MTMTDTQSTQRILMRLETGVRDVYSSKAWKDYLNVLARFHRYSYRNTLLIYMQKPDATMIGGYRFWQNEFSRYVRKGEKGIRILVPLRVKNEEDDEPEVTGWRTGTVFDISQTDGRPLDIELASPPDHAECDPMFLQALLLASPVPVYFRKTPEGVNGYFRPLEGDITIRRGMSPAQSARTLLHEIAHALLHTENNSCARADRIRREIEAESIAYAVCAHYGIDTSSYSFGYIAAWSENRDLDILRQSLAAIRSTTCSLIGVIDAVRAPQKLS